jgi:hypothetical protein
LNAGAKVPQDRKQLLICKLLNSSVVCHDPAYNQTVMSGRIGSLILLSFRLNSITFVALRSRRFWCETGAVVRLEFRLLSALTLDAGNRRDLGEAFLQRPEAAAAGGYLEHASLVALGVDD